MIFKTLCENMEIKQYDPDTPRQRKILFNGPILQNMENMQRVFNKNNKSLRLNSNIIVNLALNYYFECLEKRPEPEALEYIKYKVLELNEMPDAENKETNI